MFNSFLSWLFGFFSYSFGILIYIISTPVMSILRQFIPQLDSYFSVANDFINNYIFKGLQFVKMAFVNFFHINHGVFALCVICLVISTTIFFGTRGLKLVANLWSVKNNGRSKN